MPKENNLVALKKYPMRVVKILAGVLAGIAFTAQLSLAAPSDVETKDGITVWKVPTANSAVVGFKAQAVLSAPINAVVGTIMDTPNASEWIPNTGFIQMIDRSEFSQGKAKLYYLIDMPFPLADRDLVINSKMSKNPSGIIRIDNQIASDSRYPAKPGVVRINQYTGSWLLEPLGNSKTRVTLQGDADPGGAIPIWATNLFVTKQPTDMLKNMREQVKKSRYSDYKIPF